MLLSDYNYVCAYAGRQADVTLPLNWLISEEQTKTYVEGPKKIAHSKTVYYASIPRSVRPLYYTKERRLANDRRKLLISNIYS